MKRAFWEGLCNRCGLCCFEKRITCNDGIRVTRTACRHLDIVSRRCRVYDKRETVGENCVRLTPEIVAGADWLPKNCAYRRWFAAESGKNAW